VNIDKIDRMGNYSAPQKPFCHRFHQLSQIDFAPLRIIVNIDKIDRIGNYSAPKKPFCHRFHQLSQIDIAP
jgi:hypothetical protein